MKNATTTAKFETGNVYQMTFIGDSDLRPEWICIKRTAKTVTLQRFQKTETINRRIKVDHVGGEFVVDGSYSMAPAIYAKRCVR